MRIPPFSAISLFHGAATRSLQVTICDNEYNSNIPLLDLLVATFDLLPDFTLYGLQSR